MREIHREVVTGLVAKAGGLIWYGNLSQEVLPTLYAAAAAAKSLFSEAWLLESAKSAGEEVRRAGSKIDKPLKFFVGTLRVNTEKICGVEGFKSKEESRTWFGSVMRPFEVATQGWIPPASPAEDVKPVPREPTAEERAAAAQRLNEGRAAKRRRVRNDREGDST